VKLGKRREARGESKRKHMKKRITLWLLETFVLATVSLADAQQTGKVPRIGFLDRSTASSALNMNRYSRS
jgi:hypothetical protein